MPHVGRKMRDKATISSSSHDILELRRNFLSLISRDKPCTFCWFDIQELFLGYLYSY